MPGKIPSGYHSVTPYLAMQDASAAIEFYKRALGATELYRLPMPTGRIAHAELQIGNCRIMLADEDKDWGSISARSLGGSPIGLCVYSEDADALAGRFVAAGGKELSPMKDQFYGDRSGQYEDPEGYRWTLAHSFEEVSPEEMTRRIQQLYQSAK